MDLLDIYDPIYKLDVDAGEEPGTVQVTASLTGSTHVTVDLRLEDLEKALRDVRLVNA